MKGRQREGDTKKSMFALAVGLMPVRCNMNNFAAAVALWRDQSWNSFHSSKLATVAALMSTFIRKYHYLIDIFYFYLKICFLLLICDAQVAIIWCSLAKNYYFFHAQHLCTIFGLCSLDTLMGHIIKLARIFINDSTTCRRNMIKWIAALCIPELFIVRLIAAQCRVMLNVLKFQAWNADTWVWRVAVDFHIVSSIPARSQRNSNLIGSGVGYCFGPLMSVETKQRNINEKISRVRMNGRWVQRGRGEKKKSEFSH